MERPSSPWRRWAGTEERGGALPMRTADSMSAAPQSTPLESQPLQPAPNACAALYARPVPWLPTATRPRRAQQGRAEGHLFVVYVCRIVIRKREPPPNPSAVDHPPQTKTQTGTRAGSICRGLLATLCADAARARSRAAATTGAAVGVATAGAWLLLQRGRSNLLPSSPPPPYCPDYNASCTRPCDDCQHLAQDGCAMCKRAQLQCASPLPHGVRARKPIRWLHIPKCGATMGVSVLGYACPAELPSWHVAGMAMRGGRIDVRMARSVGARHAHRGSRCGGRLLLPFDGHQPLSARDRRQGGVVAMFRRPSQRIISAYLDNYHSWGLPARLRRTIKSRAPTIAAFARFPGIRGCMAKMLAGYHCADASVNLTNGAVRRAALAALRAGSDDGGGGDTASTTSTTSGGGGARGVSGGASQRVFAFIGLTEEWEVPDDDTTSPPLAPPPRSPSLVPDHPLAGVGLPAARDARRRFAPDARRVPPPRSFGQLAPRHRVAPARPRRRRVQRVGAPRLTHRAHALPRHACTLPTAACTLCACYRSVLHGFVDHDDEAVYAEARRLFHAARRRLLAGGTAVGSASPLPPALGR